MDDIADKRLSKLSRGTGTLSGNLLRETPVYSRESIDEYGLFNENSCQSLEDVYLLQVRGANTVEEHSNEKRFDSKEASLHKTFSTKLGTLILYAESFYKNEKKKSKIVKKKRKSKAEEIKFEGTVEELANSILRFGNENLKFVSNEKGMRDERLITVRPGYSPVRYIASVSKLWKPGQVEKLVEKNALKEDHLQRYRKIKLPKIDIIPSSDYDPLLRDRPKPYSHISLPEILLKRDPAPSRISSERATDNEDRGADDASSDYARSFLSDRKSLERKKLTRKQTMQMKRLELHLPSEVIGGKSREMGEISEEDVPSEDESNDSLSDWEKMVEKTRDVVDRTFENLIRERSREEAEGSKEGVQDVNDSAEGSEDVGKFDEFDRETDGVKLEDGPYRHSDKGATEGMDYASLQKKEKEELIANLLLQGIAKEASTIESMISVEGEERVSPHSESKIILSDQVSFPTTRSLPTILGPERTKGFRGNALHGSLPSENSQKSKQTSKPGSLKDSLFISSVNKLPPIKSEPVTPNTNDCKATELDRRGVQLPALSKRTSFNATSKSKSNFDSEGDRDALFIGGRAIEVADFQMQLEDEKSESEDSDDDYDDGEDLIKVLQIKEAETKAFLKRYEEENPKSPSTGSVADTRTCQTPDSGLSPGTGRSLASEVNVLQPEQKSIQDHMIPVQEDSSRSSSASKVLSQDGTISHASSSIQRKEETQNSVTLSGREGSRMSSSMVIENGTFIEDKSEGKNSSSLDTMSKENLDNANLVASVADSPITEDGAIVAPDEKERSILESQKEGNSASPTTMSESVTGERNDQQAMLGEDEGVCMEEEKQIIAPEISDLSTVGITREDSSTKTLSDSIDIVIDGEEAFDEEKSESGSNISRRSSGLLLAQAKAAAHSALSRPKSGLDLIEDMKIAANEFGKLFGEQIQKESNEPAFLPRGRTKSEATRPTPKKIGKVKSRSVSSLSKSKSRKMVLGDVDALKAALTSFGSLSDKKKDNGDMDRKSASPKEQLTRENEERFEEGRDSVKSLPAASTKSEQSKISASPKEIQMDIISYVQPQNDEVKVEPLVQKEMKESQGSVQMVRERTVDTEEERFERALQGIVNEVNDLKEKKTPKKKKGRKAGMSADEKNHIMRDVAPASPPFRTGRAKDAKTPKGLNNKEGKESTSKGIKGKSKKDTAKKGKTKKEKQSKKVTFGKEVVSEKKENERAAVDEKVSMEVEKNGEEEQKEERIEEQDQPTAYDKYDVPISIKAAKEEAASEKEEDVRIPSNEPKGEEEIHVEESKKEDTLSHGTPQNDSKGFSFVSSNSFETDDYVAVSSIDNEDGGNRRRTDDRMQKRKLEAERRRLKVEQRRREKEEAKRKQQEQAEREEKVRQEAELEMQRMMEEVKNRRKAEEEEKERKEEEEKRRQRRLKREQEKEKREREELKRKKAAMAEKLRLEEQNRREQERLAREMEEELRKQEEEMLKEMEEHERIEYEWKKKEEEEKRLREEEERERIEREKRLIEEEEHRIKMQQLQEFHQMLLDRAKFWEGMKNSKWFLEINQRLTRAFTYSYFDLLPAMLFEFTSLRPFTPKENRFGVLPTIQEEKKNEES